VEQALVVIETPHWRLTLSPSQCYPGQAQITLLNQAHGVTELSDAQRKTLAAIKRSYENKVRLALEATDFKWTSPIGGRLQVRPRYLPTTHMFGRISWPEGMLSFHPKCGQHHPVSTEALNLLARRLSTRRG
jgi:diadenosine tetraphosphate (Ap4A) HIT family hydrolase